MSTKLMLADFAQVASGKLSILGAGWTHITAGAPMCVAGIVEVAWNATGRSHDWILELVDQDGNRVEPKPGEPISLNGKLGANRPLGLPRGSAVGVPLAINFAGLPLEPGRDYCWTFRIGDESVSLPFQTAP